MTPPTMTPTRTTMTAEEFYDWVHRPEHREGHYELDQGKVISMTPPGERHGLVCANLVFALMGYVRQLNRGYVCANDTGFLVTRDPDTVRGPDIVLYRTTRRYDDLKVRYSEEAPTLAVEVLSPSDRWPAVTRRISQFLNRGVAMVWLVDPDSRTIMVHRASQLPQVFEGNDEMTFEDVLPGFRCRVSDCFYLPGEEAPAPIEG